MAGSRAAEHHELGQVRKEAAISELLRVLRGSLVGAGDRHHRCQPRLEGGVTISPRTPEQCPGHRSMLLDVDLTTPVRRFWTEVWTEGRTETLAEIVAADTTENGERLDLDAFGRAVVRWRGVFPDFEARIEELFAVGNDRVVSRVTYSGTQAQPWLGIPANGRRISSVGIDLFRIQDDRIMELWHATDHLEAVLQLGGRIVGPDKES